MNIQTEAIQAIEAQQARVQPRSPEGPSLGHRPNDWSGSARAAWMVGEQLKDICRREAKSAELIAQDLKRKGMDITAAEKKIKAFADKHRTGNFSCVGPTEADRILREFYGLPEPQSEPVPPEPVPAPAPPLAPSSGVLDLADFL